MTLYQLIATGFLVGTNTRIARYSKRVFDDKAKALAFKDAFTKYEPKDILDNMFDLAYWTALSNR